MKKQKVLSLTLGLLIGAAVLMPRPGLAPANTLRLFASIPIAFAKPASTHIVLATHAKAKMKAYQRVPLPYPTPNVNEKMDC